MFKTKRLNRIFLRIFAPLAWFNHHDYALSHTYHHRYTLHPDGDREVVLPQSPTLRWLYVLQLLSVNITGGPMCRGLWPILRYTVTAALGLPMRADTVGDTEPVAMRAATTRSAAQSATWPRPYSGDSTPKPPLLRVSRGSWSLNALSTW